MFNTTKGTFVWRRTGPLGRIPTHDSPGECSTSWAARAAQLVGVRIYNTTQHKANLKPLCYEPTTLCSLGKRSTDWATRATQLVGVRIFNTIQHKGTPQTTCDILSLSILLIDRSPYVSCCMYVCMYVCMYEIIVHSIPAIGTYIDR